MELNGSLNYSGLYEDLRKLGIALVVGGTIGGIVDSDHISALEGLTLFAAGNIAWFIGLKFGVTENDH